MRWMVALVVIASCLLFGTAIFVAATFLLSHSRLEKRGLGRSVRAALRELTWSLLTQPLLPFYFFAGRRMGRGTGRPVVFIHGYFQNRVGFIGLARALERRGLGPLYGFNFAWFLDLESISGSLDRFIDRVLSETAFDQVDLVCHSMGGLVATHYLARGGGIHKVRRCVTIATPHQGLAYRGPLLGRARSVLRSGNRLERLPSLPLLSVYSRHDNMIIPASSSELAEPAQNLVLLDVGHLAILFDAETARATAEFLMAPDPTTESAAQPSVSVPSVNAV